METPIGIRALLAEYEAASPEEADDLARMATLARQNDGWARDRPLHFTGSAFVVHPRTRRVLLRWHARQGAWLQVGGHGDPGESDPLAIAHREAEEETSLLDLVPWPDARLLQVVIVSVPANDREPRHEHADVRFVFATNTPAAAEPEDASGQLRWLSIPEAMALSSEGNVHEALRRIDGLFAQG